MKIGLIGAGNMGTALARGIGLPVVVHDIDAARAQALADELGGSTADSPSELASQVDVVVLAHKPGQLDDVAGRMGGSAKAIASILGGTSVTAIETAYPETPVYRFMPNLPAEVGQGVFCYSPGSRAAEGPERELLEVVGRAGTVIELEEPLLEPATALMGCAPAFFALVVEALVNAGVRNGLEPAVAGRMTVATMAGTASVLQEREFDTAELQRRVASPGGSTERGLEALEAAGLRGAFDDAVAAVLGTAYR